MSQKLVCVEEEVDVIPPMPSFVVQHAHYHTPPDSMLIIPDPIEAYYKSLGLSKAPDPDKLNYLDMSQQPNKTNNNQQCKTNLHTCTNRSPTCMQYP